MTILVIIRFPVGLDIIADWASRNMPLLESIEALFSKHGRISHRVAVSPCEFVDLDEWPSREAYGAFKAEAAPLIERFEAAFGYKGEDRIYDLLPLQS